MVFFKMCVFMLAKRVPQFGPDWFANSYCESRDLSHFHYCQSNDIAVLLAYIYTVHTFWKYFLLNTSYFPEEGFEGVHKKELVNWYLKEMEGDIDTEAELLEKKEKVEKVIERLIHHVSKQRPLFNKDYVICKYDYRWWDRWEDWIGTVISHNLTYCVCVWLAVQNLTVTNTGLYHICTHPEQCTYWVQH